MPQSNPELKAINNTLTDIHKVLVALNKNVAEVGKLLQPRVVMQLPDPVVPDDPLPVTSHGG